MTECIDLSRLQETSEGDLEFEKELIEMYLEDAEKHVRNIENNYSDLDTRALRQIAHTLKGSSANIGASRIQRTTIEIENALQEGKPEQIGNHVVRLKQAFEDTQAAYRSYVASLPE